MSRFEERGGGREKERERRGEMGCKLLLFSGIGCERYVVDLSHENRDRLFVHLTSTRSIDNLGSACCKENAWLGGTGVSRAENHARSSWQVEQSLGNRSVFKLMLFTLPPSLSTSNLNYASAY